MEEPSGGHVAPTMAYMNTSPLKGGLTWAQCELVKVRRHWTTALQWSNDIGPLHCAFAPSHLLRLICALLSKGLRAVML